MATVAELREQAAELRAQKRLLSEAAAAGLTGRQKRVQGTLLRENRTALAVAERELRAIEAGWEPFEPSPDWLQGYVEDPRFLRGHVRLASVVAALPLAAAAGVALALHWDVLPSALLAFVLALGVQAALHGVLGRVAQERDKRRLHSGEVRLFNAPMPARAAIAYKRARESGLFDTFVVCSPRAKDFCAVSAAEAPSLGLLDPVLAGRIGRHSFLVAQWDLSRDLAQI